MQHILTYESFFDADPECPPETTKASISDTMMEFDLLLPMATNLVQQLADQEDRLKAVAWIRKLRKESDQSKSQLRNEYLKLLIFVLQHKKLAGPFKKPPEGILQPFPGNLDLMGMAKEIQKEYKDAGFGDGPPVTAEASHDLKTYSAVQEIPGFGIQCYFAFSKKDQLPLWENGDKSFIPTKTIGSLRKPKMKKTKEIIHKPTSSPTQAMLCTTRRMQEYFPVQIERPVGATASELNTMEQDHHTKLPEYSHFGHSTVISRDSNPPPQPEPHLEYSLPQEDGTFRCPHSSTYNDSNRGEGMPKYYNNTYTIPNPVQVSGYEAIHAARENEMDFPIMTETMTIQPGEEYIQYAPDDYTGSSDDFFLESVASPEIEVHRLPIEERERELNTWLETDYNRGLESNYLEDTFFGMDWQASGVNTVDGRTCDTPTVNVEHPENSANISLGTRERNLNAFLDRNKGMILMYQPDSEPFGETRAPYDQVGFEPEIGEYPEMRYQFLDDRPITQYADIPVQDQELYEECWNQPADVDYIPDPELQLHWIEGIGHP